MNKSSALSEEMQRAFNDALFQKRESSPHLKNETNEQRYQRILPQQQRSGYSAHARDSAGNRIKMHYGGK